MRCLILDGKTEDDLCERDEGRDMIREMLNKQFLLENAGGEYGYPVFNGRGKVQKVDIVEVPPGSEVVLASDGYPILMASLEESEKKLIELMKSDPLCYKEYKSTKGLTKGNVSFDDRTYLRFVTD